MHLREVLLREARRNANVDAFIYGQQRMSFSRLKERGCRLANALSALGVKPADRVGILLYNCFEYPEMLWANFMLGSVAVTLNFRLVSDEILYAQEVADVNVLILGEEFIERIEPIKDRLGIDHYICLGKEAQPGMSLYSDLMQNARADIPPFAGNDQDAAVVLFTSGTAGFPKAVVLTQTS